MNAYIKQDNKKNTMPKVLILMAVYKPNYAWFKKQLISLNNQTYKNLKLIIYDDCPAEHLNENIVKNIIVNFNYEIIRGKENKGSNFAFEQLTKIAQGKYFAYCDQDDIWEKEKIEILVKTIEKEKSVLAYSDMSVIDGEGRKTADTLIKAKPRIKYIFGENLFEKFFFRNCVSGCCMLVKSEIAKKAVPFSKVTIHDQWICIIASLYGKISFIDKPLMKYRIHGNNQTGSLKEINNKEDYYKLRVFILEQRINEFEQHINVNELLSSEKFLKMKKFCYARINKSMLKIFIYRKFDYKDSYFEIMMKFMPEFIFKKVIRFLKK